MQSDSAESLSRKMIFCVVNKCCFSCPDCKLYSLLFGVMSEGRIIRVKASSVIALRHRSFTGSWSLDELPRKKQMSKRCNEHHFLPRHEQGCSDLKITISSVSKGLGKTSALYRCCKAPLVDLKID